MRSNRTSIQWIVLAFALALSSAAYAQDSNGSSQAQGASSSTSQTRSVSDGQKLKIEGIVTKRGADAFTVCASDGTETIVLVTDKTNVKTVRKGLFRRDQPSGASDILRGLRLKVEGRGNSDGQLVAENVRFDEQDLRTAQSLESRVDPVENLANSTQVLAESNEARIDYHQMKIEEAEQNAQRLAGQVEELNSVANAAGAAAKNAQATADQAQSNANIANNRIDNLGEYAVVKIVTVHFKTGSAFLSRKAKAEIDEAATSVQAENLRGWIISVVGYADSRGRATKNRSLSERRANAVINYLVTQHNIPLQLVVQPFGYGSLNPIESNYTSEGRARNRRAEIRVLINKGISQASL